MQFDSNPDLVSSKFNDQRVHRCIMWLIGGALGLALWGWDYAIDSVGARETFGLRMLLSVVGIVAALMHLPSIPKLLQQCAGIVGFFAGNVILFFILMRLHDGMIYGIGGFIFIQMGFGLMVFQGFSMASIVLVQLAAPGLPHLLALLFPNTGFPHLQYAVLIWPAAGATIVAHYMLHLAYCRSYGLNQKLQLLARTDPLTGTFTRRFFSDVSLGMLKAAKRHKKPLMIMVLDVDHFKRVNDTYGHAAGDLVLQHLADVARRTLRETDLLCRWGGEEFVVLLPETELAGGLQTAERLRAAVQNKQVETNNGSNIQVTVSIGLSSVQQGEQELAPTIARADAALYRAKSLGRNQVQSEEG